MRTTWRRLGGLAILVAAALIALAACGTPSSPHVASLPTSSASGAGTGTGKGSSPSTQPGGNATKLVDEWAACIRRHGDPNQPDPVIDAYGVINITVPLGVYSGPKGGTETQTGPCSQYLAAAQRVLRAANPVAPPPSQAQILNYVSCMRVNGEPNYPSPVGDKTNFNGTGVDPNSALFKKANELCGKKIGAPSWWIAGTGPPGDVSVESAGLNGNGPPALPARSPGTSGGSGANSGG